MGAGILDVLSWMCIVSGSMFIIIGGIGVLRLPDFYTRIHAAGITDTVGTWLMVIGLMLQAGSLHIVVRLVLLLFLLVATSPLASHALAKAAYLRGLDPLQGRDLVDRGKVDDVDA